MWGTNFGSQGRLLLNHLEALLIVHIPDRWESAENWKQNSDPRSIYSVTSRITSMLSFLRSSSPLQIGCCCSVVQSCLTLCKPMDCSTPGFPVLHCLLELAQTHVHWVGDAIHLILCCPLLLLPSIFPSIRVSSNKSALHIRWPKYWSFRFSISRSSEHLGLISFGIHWLGKLNYPFIHGMPDSWEKTSHQ